MTWGELRKCLARSRSSERLAVGVGVGVGNDDDDDEARSDKELAGDVSIERGSDSDGATDVCELFLLLVVIAMLKTSFAKHRPGCPHRNLSETAAVILHLSL
jgi:hypothetical protein